MTLGDLLEEKDRKMFQEETERLVKEFKEKGHILAPSLGFFCKDREHLVHTPLPNPGILNDKRCKIALVKALTNYKEWMEKEGTAEPYGFFAITEVWYVKKHKSEVQSKEDLIKASEKLENDEDPTKSEALNIFVNTKEGDYHALIDIIRDEDNPDNFVVNVEDYLMEKFIKPEERGVFNIEGLFTFF